VWVTGVPASGKSTLVAALVAQLRERGVKPAVLESDAMRPILTPHAGYREDDRELFYRVLAGLGVLLTRHGIPVIFDATANRRSYRNRARRAIPRFIEVFVECPLPVAMARDPKNIYRKAREGEASAVPGLQAAYEPPEAPEVVVRGDRDTPEDAARRVVRHLRKKKFIAK
jgi:adenylylsulfate kinase